MSELACRLRMERHGSVIIGDSRLRLALPMASHDERRPLSAGNLQLRLRAPPQAHIIPPRGADSWSRLGPYEVTALLGEGGMGQVYRTTDTNLKRRVAIKVLPASVAVVGEGADQKPRTNVRYANRETGLMFPIVLQVYGQISPE